MVARGEIWWHEEESEGRRPYLILTRDEGIEVLQHLLAVPATRTIRGIPTEVRLGPDDGMPVECVLSFDNLRLVRKSLLVEKITRLDEAMMEKACSALEFAVGCR